MNEFSLIADYFAPLARAFPGSLNLRDDAALIDVPPGQELVITKDALSAGVHFLGSEEPGLIAQKCLRVNLSDLAAMGATPLAYFLAVMLPRSTTEDWFNVFCAGLAEDQTRYGIHLAGGDTIATHGPASFSITALGLVPRGQALRRSGAQPGDLIVVSGTLGDSALGLDALQGRLNGNDPDFLTQRYLLPEPRLALGERLRSLASSAIDISDGLLQDLGHLCRASSVGATIRRAQLPLSATARKQVEADAGIWERIIAGGDDYELLFTISAEKQSAIAALAGELGVPLTIIGRMVAGNSINICDEEGEKLAIGHAGFQHFT